MYSRSITSSSSTLRSHHHVLDSPSAQRTNPLHEAVENGHLAIAEYLLFEQDFRADDKSREVSNGETALTIAASRGDLEMVKLLLRAGADIFYSPPAATGTALDQSARNGQWHVAQFLLAEMKRRIYEGTPDDGYAEHGGLFASREFQLQRLENSITVRILEGDFAPLVRQALGAAIRVRDAELVDALLSDTALEIIAGETGVELLCDAVDAHSAEMVQVLLRHGADPNAMTSNRAVLPMEFKYILVPCSPEITQCSPKFGDSSQEWARDAMERVEM